MADTKTNEETEKKKKEEESDDEESEILEESPCGRWSKRRQEVQQRDVPGIEGAYLAMDTEEGMEVVWNEIKVRIPRDKPEKQERKKRSSVEKKEENKRGRQEEKIQEVFDNLMQINHPNIVKLHKYWIDDQDDKRRVVFITEYMSSGSLKKFLKLTKRNVKKLPLQSWKRWCSQILSALSYLHSCSPPIIHGNLNTDSIFIQQNGLVKIGSVAPEAIGTTVKTSKENTKNMHFIAPEYAKQKECERVFPSSDIYSFGMCALEMAALEIPGNGDTGIKITKELINKTIDSLDNEGQKDFIRQCLDLNPEKRPLSSKLLFHPVLYEVQPLKLIAAHYLIFNSKHSKPREAQMEEGIKRVSETDFDVASVNKNNHTTIVKRSDIPESEKLGSYMEKIRKEYHKYGLYPLTADKFPVVVKKEKRPLSPENKAPPVEKREPLVEARRISSMMCTLRFLEDGCALTISLRLEDKMNRQLTTYNFQEVSPQMLANELVGFGFINVLDRENVAATIEAEMTRVKMAAPRPEFTGPRLEINGDIDPAGLCKAHP